VVLAVSCARATVVQAYAKPRASRCATHHQLPFWLLRMAASADRTRNAASVHAVASLLHDLNPCGDEQQLQRGLDGTFEQFLVAQGEFVSRLLELTARPCKVLVERALKHAFVGGSPGLLVAFASMVCKTVSHCRQVARFTRTGTKLGPATWRIVKFFDKREKETQLKKTGRRLLKRTTTGSSVHSMHVVPSPIDLVEVSSTDLEEEDAHEDKGCSSRDAILAIYGVGPASGHAAAAAAQAAPSQPPAPKQLQYLTGDGLVRAAPDGAMQCAVMTAGPNGFALATFAGEPAIETEVPNIVLPAPSVKETPRVRQRPASSCSNYGTCWYAQQGRAAVRRNFGDKKQIASFKKESWSQEQLMDVARNIAMKLSTGAAAEDDVQGLVAESLAA